MRIIYRIRNIRDGKIYVGQTKNLAQRKAGHLYSARKGVNRHLYRAIRDEGESFFLFEVVEEVEYEIVANEREKYWISYYDSLNSEHGYNLTSGGQGLFVHREENKTKMSPWLGKQLPDEMRKKIAKSQIGKKLSVEHKRKITESQTGEKSYWSGRLHSEETKKRMSHSKRRLSDNQMREILQKFRDGKSRRELAVEYDVSYLTIKSVISGRLKLLFD